MLGVVGRVVEEGLADGPLCRAGDDHAVAVGTLMVQEVPQPPRDVLAPASEADDMRAGGLAAIAQPVVIVIGEAKATPPRAIRPSEEKGLGWSGDQERGAAYHLAAGRFIATRLRLLNMQLPGEHLQRCRLGGLAALLQGGDLLGDELLCRVQRKPGVVRSSFGLQEIIQGDLCGYALVVLRE